MSEWETGLLTSVPSAMQNDRYRAEVDAQRLRMVRLLDNAGGYELIIGPRPPLDR